MDSLNSSGGKTGLGWYSTMCSIYIMNAFSCDSTREPKAAFDETL